MAKDKSIVDFIKDLPETPVNTPVTILAFDGKRLSRVDYPLVSYVVNDLSSKKLSESKVPEKVEEPIFTGFVVKEVYSDGVAEFTYNGSDWTKVVSK